MNVLKEPEIEDFGLTATERESAESHERHFWLYVFIITVLVAIPVGLHRFYILSPHLPRTGSRLAAVIFGNWLIVASIGGTIAHFARKFGLIENRKLAAFRKARREFDLEKDQEYWAQRQSEMDELNKGRSIIRAWGQLLERGQVHIAESDLPASPDEIFQAIVKEALITLGDPKAPKRRLTDLRSSLVFLSSVMPDEIAEQARLRDRAFQLASKGNKKALDAALALGDGLPRESHTTNWVELFDQALRTQSR